MIDGMCMRTYLRRRLSQHTGEDQFVCRTQGRTMVLESLESEKHKLTERTVFLQIVKQSSLKERGQRARFRKSPSSH